MENHLEDFFTDSKIARQAQKSIEEGSLTVIIIEEEDRLEECAKRVSQVTGGKRPIVLSEDNDDDTAWDALFSQADEPDVVVATDDSAHTFKRYLSKFAEFTHDAEGDPDFKCDGWSYWLDDLEVSCEGANCVVVEAGNKTYTFYADRTTAEEEAEEMLRENAAEYFSQDQLVEVALRAIENDDSGALDELVSDVLDHDICMALGQEEEFSHYDCEFSEEFEELLGFSPDVVFCRR